MLVVSIMAAGGRGLSFGETWLLSGVCSLGFASLGCARKPPQLVMRGLMLVASIMAVGGRGLG